MIESASSGRSPLNCVRKPSNLVDFRSSIRPRDASKLRDLIGLLCFGDGMEWKAERERKKFLHIVGMADSLDQFENYFARSEHCRIASDIR